MQCICAICRCIGHKNDAVIDVVGKITFSIVVCHALVQGADVQVTREDDAVIGAV